MRGRQIRGLVGAMAAVMALMTVFVTPVAALGSIITVNSLSDGAPANDGACTLREAIIAANTNTASGAASGECQAGTNDPGNPDAIVFSVAGTITLGSNLPNVASSLSIDGDFAITIDGQDTWLPFYIESGIVELHDLVIVNGFSTFGGAIANGGTYLLVEKTSIRSSHATYGGGIYNNGGSTGLTLQDSTVSGNAAQYGGGVYNDAAAITIVNSTIANNSASTSGGGIYALGSLTTINATIARNSAPVGGGIHQAAGAMSLYNTLVLGNTTANVLAAGTVSQTRSLTAGSGSGIIDTALRNNGGHTQTVRLLATGTSAIDKADSTYCGYVPVDERGVIRSDGACDIGAVELDKVAPKMTSGPKASLRGANGVFLSGTSSRARITFSGTDNAGGSGVGRYTLAQSVDGGAWKTLSSAISTTHYDKLLARGHTYRFRVRVADHDGNRSAWKYGPTFSVKLIQQTSTSVVYSSGWTTQSLTVFSGGSAKHAGTLGRAVRFTFSGRSVAFVTSAWIGGGVVAVYVDGVRQPNDVLLGEDSHNDYRMQAFAKTWSSVGTHTVRFVITLAGRVDVDAFAVLK